VAKKKKKKGLKAKKHRQLGVDLFNFTWDLMDQGDRTADEDELMVHAAHASAFHWRQVGTPLNFARSSWQVSRVYALLGLSESALYHAQRSLDICLAEGIGDFDLAFAFEAVARANAVAGNEEQAREYMVKARAAGELIEKKGDREYFLAELETIFPEAEEFEEPSAGEEGE